MNGDIYSAIEDVQARAVEQDPQQDFDKEKWAEGKRLERDALFERADRATEKVMNDPAALKDYLSVLARFPKHSARNALLIFDQSKDASRVMSFEGWKAEGVSIKKGQHAISILVPGDEYPRDDGSVGTSFNVRKVFDASQTTARHLEPRYPDTNSALLALIKSSPADIKVVDEHAQVENVRFDFDTSTITVVKGLEPEVIFKELAKEIAHADIARESGAFDRNLQAEDAALAGYVVAKRFGIDVSDQVPVLSSTFGEEPLKEVRAQLSRVRDSAKAITDRMDGAIEAQKVQTSGTKQKSARGANNEAR